MRLQTSVFPDRVEILDVENLAIQCQRAKELEEAGEFERGGLRWGRRRRRRDG